MHLNCVDTISSKELIFDFLKKGQELLSTVHYVINVVCYQIDHSSIDYQ